MLGDDLLGHGCDQQQGAVGVWRRQGLKVRYHLFRLERHVFFEYALEDLIHASRVFEGQVEIAQHGSVGR